MEPISLSAQPPPRSTPLPRTSMDVAPPRASVDRDLAKDLDEDEDKAEEGLSLSASPSMLTFLEPFPISSDGKHDLLNQPSMESMRTVSSGIGSITPPSSIILGSSSSPIIGVGRSLSIPGSSFTTTGVSPASSSWPPRSSSLGLSLRALPEGQLPHRQVAIKASDPSLIEGASLGTSSQLASDQAQLCKGGNREREQYQCLVSDPAVSIPGPGTLGANDTGPIPKTDCWSSINEASLDIEKHGKTLAARCWQEDETFLVKENIAEWLGGT